MESVVGKVFVQPQRAETRDRALLARCKTLRMEVTEGIFESEGMAAAEPFRPAPCPGRWRHLESSRSAVGSAGRAAQHVLSALLGGNPATHSPLLLFALGDAGAAGHGSEIVICAGRDTVRSSGARKVFDAEGFLPRSVCHPSVDFSIRVLHCFYIRFAQTPPYFSSFLSLTRPFTTRSFPTA